MDYHAKVDACCLLAGGNTDDWNYKFKLALKLAGLKLSIGYKEDLYYPNGKPYMAPEPYGEQDGWHRGSFIVMDTQ